MRLLRRTVLLVALAALAPALSACESFDMDKLDVFGLNKEKPLPGDRKPVFPGGVPGVTQGIPPEYLRQNQQQQQQNGTAEAQPAGADGQNQATGQPVQTSSSATKPKPSGTSSR